jgi:tripartite-type tricarboxylate transporter receptor subunit TctC
VLKDPELLARYQTLGLQQPTATTSAQFASVIQQESAKWAATIKQAHIAAE